MLPEAVEKHLTTRQTLQRIAKRLGIDTESENHVLAGMIEERVNTLTVLFSRTIKIASQSLGIKCSICQDDCGPFVPNTVAGLICEDCHQILERSTRNAEEMHRKGQS